MGGEKKKCLYIHRELFKERVLSLTPNAWAPPALSLLAIPTFYIPARAQEHANTFHRFLELRGKAEVDFGATRRRREGAQAPVIP